MSPSTSGSCFNVSTSSKIWDSAAARACRTRDATHCRYSWQSPQFESSSRILDSNCLGSREEEVEEVEEEEEEETTPAFAECLSEGWVLLPCVDWRLLEVLLLPMSWVLLRMPESASEAGVTAVGEVTTAALLLCCRETLYGVKSATSAFLRLTKLTTKSPDFLSIFPLIHFRCASDSRNAGSFLYELCFTSKTDPEGRRGSRCWFQRTEEEIGSIVSLTVLASA
mmetsp:Transcript_16940/g.30744  ORF Transcript_16940/g.30744 Transcript_16940/m.30744 type:complete len:225 (+) Transcript_16940:395-1069(+)